jgi:CBS domain-containing protein
VKSVAQLAVRVRTLEPQDPLVKAAEAVRLSGLGAAPVVEGTRVVGMVTQQSLTRAFAEMSPETAGDALVADLPLEPVIALPSALPPHDAILFFRANGLEAAPVVDPDGSFRGLVSAADLASDLCGRGRLPLIGGMATPMGVYLTGGGVRGGVGDAALCLTGAYLAGLTAVAALAADALFSLTGLPRHIPELAAWLQTIPSPQRAHLAMLFAAGLFAMLFRLSWVTGYHAAEHQVVHVLEAGDALTPEAVRRKPRVHPRCGTNLVAAVILMWLFWKLSREAVYYPSLQGLAVWVEALNPLLAMLATLALWRRVGNALQKYITTRPATSRQIGSGIRAANDLLRRYRSRGPMPITSWNRLWNSGLLQVLSGWLAFFLLLQLVARVFPIPSVLRLF